MIATCREFLVQYGKSGGVGRFQTVETIELRRGQNVVIESVRGIELGQVLCSATERHQRVLDDAPPGRLLRKASAEDERQAALMQSRAQALFDDCCETAAQMELPLEIVDVDLLLDGSRAVVQHLCGVECELQPYVEALAEKYNLPVFLEDLAADIPIKEPESAGCGKPDCGKTSGGGCTDCSTGGCSSCGSAKTDVSQYFAHLRTKMESDDRRTPLL